MLFVTPVSANFGYGFGCGLLDHAKTRWAELFALGAASKTKTTKGQMRLG